MKPTLQTPWSWTCSLQNCEETSLRCSSHQPMASLHGSPSKPIHCVRQNSKNNSQWPSFLYNPFSFKCGWNLWIWWDSTSRIMLYYMAKGKLFKCSYSNHMRSLRAERFFQLIAEEEVRDWKHDVWGSFDKGLLALKMEEVTCQGMWVTFSC